MWMRCPHTKNLPLPLLSDILLNYPGVVRAWHWIHYRPGLLMRLHVTCSCKKNLNWHLILSHLPDLTPFTVNNSCLLSRIRSVQFAVRQRGNIWTDEVCDIHVCNYDIMQSCPFLKTVVYLCGHSFEVCLCDAIEFEMKLICLEMNEI